MGWESLIATIEEARAMEREEATAVPVECPNDFTTLQEGPNGTLFCPWDGWQYPKDA